MCSNYDLEFWTKYRVLPSVNWYRQGVFTRKISTLHPLFTLSSSTTHDICNFCIPYATGTSFAAKKIAISDMVWLHTILVLQALHAPQTSPSVVTSRTTLSNSFMSVSSSHGFTAKMMLDFAIRGPSNSNREIYNYNVLEN